MDATNHNEAGNTGRPITILAALAALLTWMSQPPLGWWPMAMVAIVPWLAIACLKRPLGRRDYFLIWLAGFLYWAFTLQGLRHAHPAIYAGWIALSVYLAVYVVLFVLIVRQMLSRRFPVWLAAPVTWVGLECVRGYLLTGLSAAMLGHALAGVPVMIQIADLFGSYGLSFLLVVINVAVFQLLVAGLRRFSWMPDASEENDTDTWREVLVTVYSSSSLTQSIAVACLMTGATLLYGNHRLTEPVEKPLATFALVQRNEHVEFQQDRNREMKIFVSYMEQTIRAFGMGKSVDAVVWPESMFAGGLPLFLADQDAIVPAAFDTTPAEFQRWVAESRDLFLRRARDLQYSAAQASGSPKTPHLIVGCGVVNYGQIPESYSGVIHVPPPKGLNDASVDWYGKTHLVMIGEYIPIFSRLPWIGDFIKSQGLGLSTGPGPKRFMVGDTTVSPNICIETAVERVTVNQVRALGREGELPNVVVTVTNDGWFDQTSVIDHHLRCAQLVAVGCRRPLLSAANNGPTAWIDSCGKIVQQVPKGTNGTLMATPKQDTRTSLYVRIGDWPARILAFLCVGFLVDAWRSRTRVPGGREPANQSVDDSGADTG